MGIPPTTPVPTIDATGLHLPDFTQVLQYFKQGYQNIYGSDVYLENDSQDGQLMSLFALAVDDLNSAIGAAYNAYSPSTAQGVGLSQAVKINGIAREVPSNSTCDVYCVGVAGTQLINAYVMDENSIQWNLPSPTTIGFTGDVTVTATCATSGAVRADPGTITTIGTPTLGWQTVTNLSSAAIGNPVETDAGLRNRQTVSTMLPSQTGLDGLQGALEAIPAVTDNPVTNSPNVRIYENDTDGPISYIPSTFMMFPQHSISCVVDGGDINEIAATIMNKKTPGCYTNGTTDVLVTTPSGIPQTIRFSRPLDVEIIYQITLYALSGFTQQIQDMIAQEVADWTVGIGIGARIDWVKALVPAQLYGQLPQLNTFEIVSVQMAVEGNNYAQSDIVLDWNQMPICDPTVDVSFLIPPTPYGFKKRRRNAHH